MSIIAEDRKQMRSGNWFSTWQKAKTSMSAESYTNGKQADSWGRSPERPRNWKHQPSWRAGGSCRSVRNNQTPTVPLTYSVRQLPSFPPASEEARDLFSRATETGRVGLREAGTQRFQAELVSMRHRAEYRRIRRKLLANQLLSPNQHSEPVARGKPSRARRPKDSSPEKLTSIAPEKRPPDALISVLN